MINFLLKKIIGSKNERELRKLTPILEAINALEPEISKLTDQQLANKTDEFKERLAKGESLDDLLVEAFAVVREVAKRTINMRHFDVQILGGIVLHQGKIAEMATGEGKTLVATLPLYLNALTGKGCHLVTVNDYLARRDAEWMGPIYHFLKLKVGVLNHEKAYLYSPKPGGRKTNLGSGEELVEVSRKEAYLADITYGTNTEFGFDYLRDNMALSVDDIVQREFYYAIIDEVDSILIDEARVPLIISGPVERSYHQYAELRNPVERLVHAQTLLVNRLVAEAEQLLTEGREEEAAVKLLQAKRGAPKHKRLMKLLADQTKLMKLVDRAELNYMRDKRLNELDEELYFVIDERERIADLTEKGRQFISPKDPSFFVIPDLDAEYQKIDEDQTLSFEEKLEKKLKVEEEFIIKRERIHNISQLLRAYSLFEKDVDYVVKDNKVILVDEFTGRLLPGRRLSDGLHEALEAKERVKIETETQTLATITIQNYFRMYPKLAGMTGTAVDNATEFYDVYNLDVVVIPTNKPVRRIDYDDVIFKTKREKYNAIIEEILKAHSVGRPVLVGTTSVETSETLGRLLSRRGIKDFSILNAKHHEKEAQIVAKAGQPYAITIATNMAGRGTDIVLGPGVVKCTKCCIKCEDEDCANCYKGKKMIECFAEVPCGLYVIGSERHEASRIDRQLRGRCGRQGDPGSSRFFLSLEDDLMRLFGSDRLISVMDRLGVPEGEAIQHPLVTKAIATAQKRVEENNFAIRKRLLEFDDILNRQREVIYTLRRELLEGKNISPEVVEVLIPESIEKFNIPADTLETGFSLKELALLMSQEALEKKVDELFTSATDKVAQFEYETENNRAEELAKSEIIKGVLTWFYSIAPFSSARLRTLTIDKIDKETKNELIERLTEEFKLVYEEREKKLGPELMRTIEKIVFLRSVDSSWREHLLAMDMLREGISVRTMGVGSEIDPLVVYKKEGHEQFLQTIENIKNQVLSVIYKLQPIVEKPAFTKIQPRRAQPAEATVSASVYASKNIEPTTTTKITAPTAPTAPLTAKKQKIGRNDPCPCGSGKKYKKCCGAT